MAGGQNTVSILYDERELLVGCVQGSSPVLTSVLGVTLHSAMCLTSTKPYVLFTVNTMEAKDEALCALLGLLLITLYFITNFFLRSWKLES